MAAGGRFRFTIFLPFGQSIASFVRFLRLCRFDLISDSLGCRNHTGFGGFCEDFFDLFFTSSRVHTASEPSVASRTTTAMKISPITPSLLPFQFRPFWLRDSDVEIEGVERLFERCDGKVAAFLVIGVKKNGVPSLVRHPCHWVLQQSPQIIHSQPGLLQDSRQRLGLEDFAAWTGTVTRPCFVGCAS